MSSAASAASEEEEEEEEESEGEPLTAFSRAPRFAPDKDDGDALDEDVSPPSAPPRRSLRAWCDTLAS